MNLFGNKKFYFIYLFLIFFFSSNLLALENKILVKIEDKIITSLDVNDEINYLQALNPNVRKLDNSTLFKIGKNSIIREKVKEIEIFFLYTSYQTQQ